MDRPQDCSAFHKTAAAGPPAIFSRNSIPTDRDPVQRTFRRCTAHQFRDQVFRAIPTAQIKKMPVPVFRFQSLNKLCGTEKFGTVSTLGQGQRDKCVEQSYNTRRKNSLWSGIFSLL